MKKKTLLIDLDGVLNEYKGNYDENVLPALKEGALEFLQKLCEKFELVLFSTRNLQKVTIWVEENNLQGFFSDITNVKKLSYLILDDRCVRFTGDYAKALEEIENFKVWWRP